MKLKCYTLEDINLLSMLCQDAVFSPGWHLLEDNILKIFIRRFCCELHGSVRRDCIVKVHNVQRKKFLLCAKEHHHDFLSLLCIVVKKRGMDLNAHHRQVPKSSSYQIHFILAPHITLDLVVSSIHITLEDVSEGIQSHKPSHAYRKEEEHEDRFPQQ